MRRVSRGESRSTVNIHHGRFMSSFVIGKNTRGSPSKALRKSLPEVSASVAILIRQTGLALPVAFACALLTKNGIKPRYVVSALILVASGIGIQFAYQTWLFENGLAPAKYNN